MPSFWADPELQENILAYLCRDRNFLKRTAGLLEPDDFKPRKNASEGHDRHILAQIALQYWHEYHMPVGGLLKAEVLDYCRQHRKEIPEKMRDKIMDLASRIRGAQDLIAVEAVENKVITYKTQRILSHTIQDLIEAQEQGSLTPDSFFSISKDAFRTIRANYDVSDILKGLDKRIARRQLERMHKWPYTFIDCIDENIRTIRRGTVGMSLAKWKMGKSLLFVWLAMAYALQGYNVLLFTLEDPREEYEDRIDANFTNIAIRELENKSDLLKQRFRKFRKRLRGRIRVIDATEGGWTCHRIEQAWEQERNQGFPADVIMIDYDDEVVPPTKREGESARRMEFGDIYRTLRQMASRLDVFMWIASQAKAGEQGTDQVILRGEDTAEDKSKVRKVAFCLGIGMLPKDLIQSEAEKENGRFLYVSAHKFDTQHIGWPIVGDFKNGIFYDRDLSIQVQHRWNDLLRKKKGKNEDHRLRRKHKKHHPTRRSESD